MSSLPFSPIESTLLPTDDPIGGVHGTERRDAPVTMGPRHRFAWSSPTAEQLNRQMDRVAAVDSTLLLLGDSGTGKSTIARMVHQRSHRHQRPFISVNCASLPRDLIDAELFGHEKGAFTGAVDSRPGRVEAADGGTLFLDEIGDLPLELQPKLLTFLQERTFYRLGSNQLRTVDVRVISATHSDLMERARNEQFRQDLFFRLAVLRIIVPTLTSRGDEIGHIATNVLDKIARSLGCGTLTLTRDAIRRLQTYHWPGNIRELENVLESAVAFRDSNTIQADDLTGIPATEPVAAAREPEDALQYVGKTLAQIEREAIIAALQHAGGNKAQTARDLGISLRSIYNKMNKYGLVIDKSLQTTSCHSLVKQQSHE